MGILAGPLDDLKQTVTLPLHLGLLLGKMKIRVSTGWLCLLLNVIMSFSWLAPRTMINRGKEFGKTLERKTSSHMVHRSPLYCPESLRPYISFRSIDLLLYPFCLIGNYSAPFRLAKLPNFQDLTEYCWIKQIFH